MTPGPHHRALSVPVVHYRVMRASDLPGAMRVQMACHVPDNLEDMATLTQRLHASPQTAWVAHTQEGIGGYLVCYRSRLAHIPALGSPFVPAPQPDCLYLHDLAVSPEARGLGLAQGLLQHAWTLAASEKLGFAALVSLHSSVNFWERQGFTVQTTLTQHQQNALASYADGPACYMTRPLAGRASSLSSARG